MTQKGYCPSCHAAVSYLSTATTAVCPSCDARFATALAATPLRKRAPAPTHGARLEELLVAAWLLLVFGISFGPLVRSLFR